MRHKELSIVM